MHTLGHWTVLSVDRFYYLGVYLSVSFHFVDLLQFCVCCLRSGVSLCIHFVVHWMYLFRVFVLHVVPRSLIGNLMHLPAAYQFHYSSMLVTACPMVRGWRVLRAGSMLLCWPELLSPISSSMFSIYLLLFYWSALWG